MIDFGALSQALTVLLAPAMPYLLQAGGKVADGALREIGKEAWEKATQAWAWLRDKVSGNPGAQAAAQELALQPGDKDNQTMFELQLKKLLAQDPELAKQLATLMKDQVVQRVLAERGAEVRRIEQEAGKGGTEQEVRAADAGTKVEDVKQRRL